MSASRAGPTAEDSRNQSICVRKMAGTSQQSAVPIRQGSELVVADEWVALRGGLPVRLDAIDGRPGERASSGQVNQSSVAGMCRVVSGSGAGAGVRFRVLRPAGDRVLPPAGGSGATAASTGRSLGAGPGIASCPDAVAGIGWGTVRAPGETPWSPSTGRPRRTRPDQAGKTGRSLAPSPTRSPPGMLTHACSLNHETTPQVSSLSSHGGGIPARPETGVGRSMRMRLKPERYRKRTCGAESVSYLLLAAACRHQPQQSCQRLHFHPELRQRPNL